MTVADLLVVGTTVRTLDPKRPWAHAIAVVGDRIVALDDDALALRGTRTEIVDLGGAVTTPGLIDGHMHPLFGAATFQGADLSGCRDLDDLRAVLTSAEPDGEGWVVAWGLDHNVFRGRTPSNQVLEEALPGAPIFVRLYDGHSALASAEALRRARVTGPRDFEQRAEIVCDATGQPTGFLVEPAAMELVQAVLPEIPRAILHARLREALQGMASTGITGGNVMDAEADALAVLDAFEAGEELPVRLRIAPWCMPGDDVEPLIDLQARRGRRWEVKAVKFFIDGTVEGGTAWLETPRLSRPGPPRVVA